MEKVFTYTGLLKNGDKVKGTIVASSAEQAKEQLVKKGIYPTKIKEKPMLLVKLLPVPYSQHVLFFGSLAKLLDSGVSLQQGVEHLANEQFNPKYELFLRSLKGYIDEGMSLADAISATGFMPPDVVEMIRVGEESGKLPEVLHSLTNLYSEKEKIKKAFTNAAVYPAMVMLMVIGLVLYAPKIFAKVQALYSRLPKAEFPKFSIVVISTLQLIAKFLPVILLGAWLAGWLLLRKRKRDQKFRLKVDRLALKTPVLGKLIVLGSNYSSFVSFRVLYEAGVPMDRSLFLIMNSQNNEVIKQAWKAVYDEVRKGLPLSQALKQNKFVSDMVKILVSVGEQSGKLDVELRDIVKYEGEVFSNYVKFINDTVTPVLLAIAGFVVALVMAALYLPILKVPQLMKGIYAH